MIKYISWERTEQIHPHKEHTPTCIKAAIPKLPVYGIILCLYPECARTSGLTQTPTKLEETSLVMFFEGGCQHAEL